MSASKLLISSAAGGGKTTLIAKLDKTLVVVTDNKSFLFKVPHYRTNGFHGVPAFKEELIGKLKAYKEKFGHKPKNVVIDSITHLYQDMYVWAEENFKGFDKFNAMQSETLALNDMLEKLLLANDVNVIITAHTVWNEGMSSFEIPSVGKFKESGGWYSLVDNAIHISTENNRRIVFTSSLKYPARTTVDIDDKMNIDKYDIVEHMKLLDEAQAESGDYSL